MNGASLPWRTAWRIARRDLSARFKGLRLLLVCLFLGVGALAAIGTLTGGIERELESRGRVLLGGDVEATIWQRLPTADEQAAFATMGTVSAGTRMQAMASADGVAVPVELKAVDAQWPMIGSFTLTDGRTARAPPPGTAWIAAGAAERLAVRQGDRFTLGGRKLTVGGIIADEPDRLSEGFALGPVVIVDASLPQAAGLLAPGAMFRSKTRILLPPGASPDAAIDAFKARFPDASFSWRTRDNAAPGAERFVARMGEFLVLVGLAALVIAGIGIGGGVSAYLEARRTAIATLKVLGASSGDIARIYLLQVGAAALAGSLAGLAAGVAVTPLVARALEGLLPVQGGFAVDPGALLRAMAYGLLVALVFAAPPLVRARRFPAMALMRARVSALPAARREVLVPVGLGLAAIVGLALVTAAQIQVTALFLAGAAAVLGLLALLGRAIVRAAARAPRPRDPILRAGLANLHRPGAQTGALVTALGFGLSAFVLLAAMQTSLTANIERRVPERAPDFFVLDVPLAKEAEFRAAVAAELPGAVVKTVPAMRGRILAYGPEGAMTTVDRSQERDGRREGPWQLRGERGMTYSRTLPEGSTLVEGKWWAPDHAGEPLVSIDEELAEPLGLKIGDMITVGILGVERTARIASIRRIEWETLGFNYVLVFSPNAIADAPHNLAATIEVAPETPRGGLLRRLVQAFPSTSVVETGALLKDARALLDQMATAILAAASVAVLAGLAVLFGAIAAARASRTYDNVILRVMGASRGQLLRLQLAEYGALALVLALVALVLGSLVAWLITVQMFEFDWLPDWPRVLAVLAGGVVLVIGFALAGSLPLLRARPAQVLREL